MLQEFRVLGLSPLPVGLFGGFVFIWLWIMRWSTYNWSAICLASIKLVRKLSFFTECSL
jgi:hypothetical protein